jgi:radical SAM superfamily enzyme YgiQ (UPF0313 family)
MSMRVLLVHPDFGATDFGFRLAAMAEPMGLEMLAAALPEHDLRIADMRCGDNLSAALRDFTPHVVGVTALTPEVYAAQAVLREVKKLAPDTTTIVGGHHATLVPEDFMLPEVDVILLGEGELTLAQLMATLDTHGPRADLSAIPNLRYRGPDGGFHATARQTAQVNLDASHLPRRDLVARHRPKYFFLFDQPDSTMVTGRGCPFRCSFCSVWEFYGGKTSMMAPPRVLRELRTIQTEHVTFVDDNFLLNYKRENAIADMIKAEGIQKRYSMECRTDSIVRHPELVKKWTNLGLYAVLLGLEGGDKMLAAVGKANTMKVNDEAIRILQGNGVIIWGAFIADPTWEPDDFHRLRDYVRSRHITHTQYSVLTPLPGTQLYRSCQNQLITRDYTCFDGLHAVVQTTMPRETFYQHFAELYTQTDLDLGHYMDLVRQGKLTIANLKRGKQMLAAMSHWENYANNDPVLRHRHRSAPPQTSHRQPPWPSGPLAPTPTQRPG